METKKRDNTVIAFVIVLVFGGLFLWWVIHTMNKSDSGKTGASITSYTAINPGTLEVHYSVQNTTDRAGKSNCSITMKDAASTYNGYGTYQSNVEIQPGQTYSGVGNVTITNNGASYVTRGGITCRIQN